ncbi:MAG: hypothetical protein V2B19_14000 [Pseudomonadota bacterium]
MPLKYTLVTDGSSDRTLIPILNWLCEIHFQEVTEGQWFDPRPFSPQTRSLGSRIILSLEWFPCNILFIHRDAEGDCHQKRCKEISQTIQSLATHPMKTPYICVIPVRMTEAWLLFDEGAIRRAAGNPNGRMGLNLPSIRDADKINDPKDFLFEAIKKASGLNNHRQKRINLSQSRIRLSELIKDFAPLRELNAFKMLEDDIINLRNSIGAVSIIQPETWR